MKILVTISLIIFLSKSVVADVLTTENYKQLFIEFLDCNYFVKDDFFSNCIQKKSSNYRDFNSIYTDILFHELDNNFIIDIKKSKKKYSFSKEINERYKEILSVKIHKAYGKIVDVRYEMKLFINNSYSENFIYVTFIEEMGLWKINSISSCQSKDVCFVDSLSDLKFNFFKSSFKINGYSLQKSIDSDSFVINDGIKD